MVEFYRHTVRHATPRHRDRSRWAVSAILTTTELMLRVPPSTTELYLDVHGTFNCLKVTRALACLRKAVHVEKDCDRRRGLRRLDDGSLPGPRAQGHRRDHPRRVLEHPDHRRGRGDVQLH